MKAFIEQQLDVKNWFSPWVKGSSVGLHKMCIAYFYSTECNWWRAQLLWLHVHPDHMSHGCSPPGMHAAQMARQAHFGETWGPLVIHAGSRTWWLCWTFLRLHRSLKCFYPTPSPHLLSLTFFWEKNLSQENKRSRVKTVSKTADDVWVDSTKRKGASCTLAMPCTVLAWAWKLGRAWGPHRSVIPWLRDKSWQMA